MPATAAIDNETLDHLLSVVDDSLNVTAAVRFWKMEFAGPENDAVVRLKGDGCHAGL